MWPGHLLPPPPNLQCHTALALDKRGSAQVPAPLLWVRGSSTWKQASRHLSKFEMQLSELTNIHMSVELEKMTSCGPVQLELFYHSKNKLKAKVFKEW